MSPPAPVFVPLLSLRPEGSDAYVGPASPERFGRVFGGQFLAQALAAAQATVDGKAVHSLHAYFVRAGDVGVPTEYRVERIREGRSFALRQVVGCQRGREAFRLTASFHAPEAGLTYEPPLDYRIADVRPPSPDQLDYPAFARRHPDFDPEGWDGGSRPMEIRYPDAPAQPERSGEPGGPPIEAPQLMWVRITEPLPADPALHAAALAYLADGTLIDNALLPHGFRWFDARLTGASLDHAMWFHRPARADEWLLYDQRVMATGAARGLATGRLYDRAGALVATCSQEGLLRWSAVSPR